MYIYKHTRDCKLLPELELEFHREMEWVALMHWRGLALSLLLSLEVMLMLSVPIINYNVSSLRSDSSSSIMCVFMFCFDIDTHNCQLANLLSNHYQRMQITIDARQYDYIDVL